MQSDQPLTGLRVLVVEDEYFLADDIEQILKAHGAEIVMLSGTVADAISRIKADGFEVALLDINLRGEMAYSAADELKQREVPFGFITGYDKQAIPERFSTIPYWSKPYDGRQLVNDVQRIWSRPASS
jgi:CheY-like chemotaxis protein